MRKYYIRMYLAAKAELLLSQDWRHAERCKDAIHTYRELALTKKAVDRACREQLRDDLRRIAGAY